MMPIYQGHNVRIGIAINTCSSRGRERTKVNHVGELPPRRRSKVIRRVIYEYTLPRKSHSPYSVTLSLTKGARVISTGIQNKNIRLWAELSIGNDMLETETERRTFWVFLTGAVIPDNGIAFIGTAIDQETWKIYHIYEETA